MASSIPWLPLDTTARPGVFFIGFNTLKPPFDDPIVRQAFAAAVDRQVIVELFDKYYPDYKARSATSLIPPETLGWDLTGAVGMPFDPQHARELLEGAGYTDPATFPAVTIFVRATLFADYPGFRLKLVEAITQMWKEPLGIEATISMTTETYRERFASNPPDIYFLGLVADVNDPDNFMNNLVSGGDFNWGKFSNPDYDRLVQQAAREVDPLTRQLLYIEAERILNELEVGIIPLNFVTRNIP